jgi:hypothetical protein
MNNFKPLLSISISILFVMLGIYLIQKEDQNAVIIGYANIIFFGFLILLSVLQLFKKK